MIGFECYNMHPGSQNSTAINPNIIVSAQQEEEAAAAAAAEDERKEGNFCNPANCIV